jgi:8-oxo-dGTP diphosphatase
MKETTLCLVLDKMRAELLMIRKKRGQGAGKWNMPGGKVASGETVAAAAVREAVEETGIRPLDPRELGILEFYFEGGSPYRSWDNRCHVFLSERYDGQVRPVGTECDAAWVPLDKIPYDQMWEDDSTWLPIALRGEPFHLVCRFDADDRMISMERLSTG